MTAVMLSPQEQRISQGRKLGLVTEDAPERRARIHAMLDGFRDLPIKLSLERAQLLTESLKGTEGQPVALRWGKALAHVLDKLPIHVGDHDVIAGSAGSSGRYAIFYPEVEGRFFQNIKNLRASKEGPSSS